MVRRILTFKNRKGSMRVLRAKAVVGWLGIICGLLGILVSGPIFFPVAVIFSLVAFFTGHIVASLMGLLIVFFGILISPVLLMKIIKMIIILYLDFEGLFDTWPWSMGGHLEI